MSPGELWKNQQTEGMNMPVEEVRRRAGTYLSRRRRDSIVEFLFTTFSIAFGVTVVVMGRIPAVRICGGLLVVVLSWQLIQRASYSFRQFGSLWPKPSLARNIAIQSCLDFYRGELERQGGFTQVPVWQIILTLVVISWLSRYAFGNLGSSALYYGMRFALFSSAALLAIFAVRKFEGRHIQAELDALDRLEEEEH